MACWNMDHWNTVYSLIFLAISTSIQFGDSPASHVTDDTTGVRGVHWGCDKSLRKLRALKGPESIDMYLGCIHHFTGICWHWKSLESRMESIGTTMISSRFPMTCIPVKWWNAFHYNDCVSWFSICKPCVFHVVFQWPYIIRYTGKTIINHPYKMVIPWLL